MIWRHLDTYGYTWIHLDTTGYILKVRLFVWSFFVFLRRLRPCRSLLCRVRPPLRQNTVRCQRRSAACGGGGSARRSMTLRLKTVAWLTGYIWIHMDTFGYIWIHSETSDFFPLKFNFFTKKINLSRKFRDFSRKNLKFSVNFSVN